MKNSQKLNVLARGLQVINDKLDALKSLYGDVYPDVTEELIELGDFVSRTVDVVVFDGDRNWVTWEELEQEVESKL